MSKIKCKYKFKNAEKFNGNAYCTCHNELCEDIAFCCDDNCQIYEDFKLLKRAEQKLEKVKEYCNKYQMEYIVNNGVQLLTTRILQIIGDEENG